MYLFKLAILRETLKDIPKCRAQDENLSTNLSTYLIECADTDVHILAVLEVGVITVHLQLCISLTLTCVLKMRIHLESSEVWQNQVVAIWNPKLQQSQLKTVGKRETGTHGF